MEDLRFGATRSQRRGLLIAAGILLAAALVLAALGYRIGGRAGGYVLGVWVPGSAGCALLCLGARIPYSRAFTECTPAVLRVRGLARIREYRWPDIDGVSIRSYRGTAAVKITTADRRHFLLWVPCDRPFAMRDREFRAKAQQIMDYWQWARRAPAREVSEL